MALLSTWMFLCVTLLRLVVQRLPTYKEWRIAQLWVRAQLIGKMLIKKKKERVQLKKMVF